MTPNIVCILADDHGCDDVSCRPKRQKYAGHAAAQYVRRPLGAALVNVGIKPRCQRMRTVLNHPGEKGAKER